MLGWVGVILVVVGFVRRKKGGAGGGWLMIIGLLVLAYDLYASYPGA